MNRLGLKISCFVVSVIIWVQVASISSVEVVTNLPLRLSGLSDGLTAANSEIPSKVKVRLQGSKLRLLTHEYFNRFIGEVRVDLTGHVPGPEFSYELGTNDVFTDLVVQGIQPPVRLRIKVDELWTRKLPVQLNMIGELSGEVAFLVAPVVKPDSVWVTGPARFFPASGVLTTREIDLARKRESGQVQALLVTPDDQLSLGVAEVAVDLLLAPVIERTLANILVIALVDAGRPEVGVSPPVVDVMVRGVADSVRTLLSSQVQVTVAVGSLERGDHILTGQVSLPPWAELIGMDPKRVRVVVGGVDTTKTITPLQDAGN
ncbi:MAG: YbbR domain-containing protein [Candidatus Krumholzibacteriia bacterium]|jgi:YbbR domain-containing protein